MAATTTRPDSWLDDAPAQMSSSLVMVATPAAIWSELADHESWPEWFTAVKTVEVTGAASGVGAERRVGLGGGVVIDEEFVAWDEGERFAFTVVAMTVPMFHTLNERVTITDLGDGRCEVTYRQGFEPRGWFRLPFKLVRRQFERGLRDGLAGLKARVE
ncbi:MAG: SRPBCC family protein [Actinomycetota bacterium]